MIEPVEQPISPALEATRAIVLAEAEHRGWREVDRTWLQDAGLSDSDLERPGLA
ncbi:MAG: hypothetical protein QOD78_1200, partial [Chloroflexota bacterium]|nr:hypothetical protein [Chloroflexota bacterium]